MNRSFKGSFVVVAFIALCASRPCLAQTYEATLLSNSFLNDINDLGQVVSGGSLNNPLMGWKNIYPGIYEGSFVTSYDILALNNYEEMVGVATTYRLGGLFSSRPFGETGGVNYSERITDDGIVVGSCGGSFTADNGACVYDGDSEEGGVHYPRLVGAINAGGWCTDSNNFGEVVGHQTVSREEGQVRRAFLYDINSMEIVEIETFGGEDSRAFGINDDGVIVGSAQYPDGTEHAFVKRPGESLIDLGTLNRDVSADLGTLNGGSSVAIDINDDGIVVGYSQTHSGEPKRAFVWDAVNGMRDLNDLVEGSIFFDSLEVASRINNGGEILIEQGVVLNPISSREALGDYDSDLTGDFAVWRQASGTWYVRTSTAPNDPLIKQWGLPGDAPMRGDIDGDGLLDLIVWRPTNGTWYSCPSADNYDCSHYVIQQFGLPGDYPLLSDFDGDGVADYAVWRPHLKVGNTEIIGQWYIRRSSDGAVMSLQWGLVGDLPVPADLDGDNKADLVVWRPWSGEWYARLSSRSYSANRGDIVVVQWGLPTDHPLAGDYDRDGKADLVVWRPETGTWYFRSSRRKYGYWNWDWSNAGVAVQYGLPGDLPLAGSYDVSSFTRQAAVWRPSIGQWYTLSLATQSPASQQWGLTGDVPIGIGIKDQVKMLYGNN